MFLSISLQSQARHGVLKKLSGGAAPPKKVELYLSFGFLSKTTTKIAGYPPKGRATYLRRKVSRDGAPAAAVVLIASGSTLPMAGETPKICQVPHIRGSAQENARLATSRTQSGAASGHVVSPARAAFPPAARRHTLPVTGTLLSHKAAATASSRKPKHPRFISASESGGKLDKVKLAILKEHVSTLIKGFPSLLVPRRGRNRC